MSEELEITGGCGCADCRRAEAEMRDNPRGGHLSPEDWLRREQKAGRGRFDAKHVGKDKPAGPSDPHYRVVDRLAGKPVLTPLRHDDEGRVVGGCDPMVGTVGGLLPTIKELQEGHVYHPTDARFDLVEDVDKDPAKDQSRMRWGIYDRASGTMIVPRSKKGDVLSGFKSQAAAKRWLSANRKNISKFTCPPTVRGLKSLKQKIVARSPEGIKAREIARAQAAAEKALKTSKKASTEYLYATSVIEAIKSGQPIPERPSKAKKTAPEAPGTPSEPERYRGKVDTGGGFRPSEPERYRGKVDTGGGFRPPESPSGTGGGFRVPMPGPQPPPEEPERVRGRIETEPPRTNPSGVSETRIKKLEQRMGSAEKNIEKVVGAVDNLGTAFKQLDSRVAKGLRAMGATKNVTKKLGSGKAKAKSKK